MLDLGLELDLDLELDLGLELGSSIPPEAFCGESVRHGSIGCCWVEEGLTTGLELWIGVCDHV